MGLGTANVNSLGQPVVTDSINDPEVNRLGSPSHIAVNFSIGRQVENPPGRAGVNVLPVLKVLLEVLITGDVGQYPQFHLGIVR